MASRPNIAIPMPPRTSHSGRQREKREVTNQAADTPSMNSIFKMLKGYLSQLSGAWFKFAVRMAPAHSSRATANTRRDRKNNKKTP